MTDKCIALVFSLLILWQAWLVRRLAGTWLFPACLFGLFWFVLTFIPLVVLLAVPMDPWAIGFILLCALAFSISSLLFDWKRAFTRNVQKRDAEAIYGSVFLKGAFHVSVAASLVLIVMTALAQGVTLHDLVFNLFVTAEAYAQLRYADVVASALAERWSIVFAYLGVIIGGLRFSCASPGGRKVIIVLSFLPSVLIALTQSAKWPFLLGIVLFYAGILVYRISAGTLHLVGRGNRKALAIYAGIVLVIVTVSFMSRLYSDDGDVGQLLSARFASYTSGHIYAFSDWFAFSTGRHSGLTYAHEPASHGYYTFGTLFKMLGSNKVVPIGVYDDDYSYGGVLLTNVFTMFRGLIMDFGYIGAVLFMSVVGLLFHGAFYSLLSSRRPVFAVAAFVFMMGFFYSSLVVSMFGSNITYYVTFSLLWIVLYANKMTTSPYRISRMNLRLHRSSV